MRRSLLLYIVLWIAGVATVRAQIDENGYDRYGNQVDPSMVPDDLDQENVEIKGLAPKLYMWRITDELGNRTQLPADTLAHQFQNSNLTEGANGHYNYLANLGAPRLSRLFFERQRESSMLFLEPYSFFITRPTDFLFTNSNVPYTNLSYHKAGNKVNGEDRFRSYFSVNANKRLAFGFLIDYLYGRGFYNNQSTSHFNTSVFGSYIGERYQIQGIYSNYYLKTNENGGITDDRYITASEEMAQGQRQYESNNIPTVLNSTTNRNHAAQLFLTQRYNIGFHRQVDVEEGDSVSTRQEFVPVTSFIHTLRVERARHSFSSDDEVPEGYYTNTYFGADSPAVKDSTIYTSIKNTVGIALLEGFNKYAKAGLTAFLSHKIGRYDLMRADAMPGYERWNENEVYVGGELSKREGNLLRYHAMGEAGLAGKAIGQFGVNGEIDLRLPLWRDTMNLVARGEVSNRLAPFYMRHYRSKHFAWDDDMEKEFRTRIEGELSIARWGTRLKVGVENIRNYTYFGTQATPEQKSGDLQVISATLQQDFRLGILHLENEAVWQKASDTEILPLPELSLYHNLYLQLKLAKKVLNLQLGADLRYFTSYYAPTYTPAIQNFHLQAAEERTKIGGYPVVNVYANFHLKRTRFYVMMYHVNQGMGRSNYFLAPHYPINPRLLKVGLSWNFYD